MRHAFALVLSLSLLMSACGPRGLVRSELAGARQEGPRKVLVVPADFVITEVTFGKTEERVVAAERQASRVLAQQIRTLAEREAQRAAERKAEGKAGQDTAFTLLDFEALSEEEQDDVLQHRALFATMVGQLLLVKEDAVDVWASKARYFDYTLGTGLKELAQTHGADTAIFIVGKDKVRSTSRKVLDTLASVLPIGESLSSQPAAVALGVVDLHTGHVLMFDSEMVKRKALTDDDDVRAMGEAVLTDFRRALAARASRR